MDATTYTVDENAAHLATLKKAAESSDVARLLLHCITDAKFARGLHDMVHARVEQINKDGAHG